MAEAMFRRQTTQSVFTDLSTRVVTKTRSQVSLRTVTKQSIRNRVYLGIVKPPVDYFMSKLSRNFATGEITIEAEAEYDFQYIDLYERSTVTALGLSLLQDEYIYRAEPLVTRSWMYQSKFELEHSTERREDLFTQGQLPIKSQNRIRQEALELPVYEATQYSPVIGISVAMMIAGLSGDSGLLASMMGLFIVCLGIALRGNDAERLSKERLMSLWLRLGWLVWRVLNLLSEEFVGIRGVCQILVLVIVVLDVVVNDVGKVVRDKVLATRYQVLKALPGKMFIVIEKKWANEYKGCDYPANIVGEDVLELINREDEDMKIDIIVDVHGLLCKLVPVTKVDLDDLLDIQDELEATKLVYSTGTFNQKRPTANDVTDKHKMVETFKKNRTSPVMKRGYSSLKRPSVEES